MSESEETVQPTHVGTSNNSASSSLSLPSVTIQKGQRKLHGPSLFEQVLSKTRPVYLPPKEKAEDLKHLSVWESMMNDSRTMEINRQSILRDRRLAQEQEIEAHISIWEREILPDWQVVRREPRYRKLWWKGIPPKIRGRLWANAIGNPLALGKDSYRNCLTRAKRDLLAGNFPSACLTAIDSDIAITLPHLKLFLPGSGPMHEDLKEFLLAWMISRFDEGFHTYISGVARVAAMLLLNMNNNQQAFIAMRNYLERGCPRAFFGGESNREDIEAYYRIFDTLLADYMPKVYFNFKQHQISPSCYLPYWLIPIFLDHLSLETCARLWDVVLLEGDSYLYRIAMAVLGVMESRLFFPDRQELLSVLSGDHKAALEVAMRSGIDTTEGRYSIFGLDEDTLWERLDDLDTWWKDSTWTRLLQRELPDV